jgi:hypothetical protein
VPVGEGDLGHVPARRRFDTGQQSKIGRPLRRSWPSARHPRPGGVDSTKIGGNGRLTGLDRTTLCATARDGGAPIVAGSIGLSMLSGGSTACDGGAVYARPIVPLLTALGRTLY